MHEGQEEGKCSRGRWSREQTPTIYGPEQLQKNTYHHVTLLVTTVAQKKRTIQHSKRRTKVQCK